MSGGAFAAYAIITAIAAALSAYSSHQQGQAAKKRADYQEEVMEQNQLLAAQQAKNTRTQAEKDKQDLRLQLARMKSEGRANYAASGLSLGSGSHQDWEGDLSERAQFDLDSIDYNADIDAWGFKVQGTDYSNQGRLKTLEGSNAERSGNLGAASSLLSGASSVAGAYSAK